MPSEKCKIALELLQSKDIAFCDDRRTKTRVVMCCSRAKVEKGEGYSQAMKSCWAEVKKRCQQ